MAKKVQIYTTTTCAYCRPVKEFLHARGMSYEEINLDTEPARRQELLALTGQLAVPVIVVTHEDNTKDVTVGFNLPRLAAAIA